MKSDNKPSRKPVVVRSMLCLAVGIVVLIIGSVILTVLTIRFGGEDVKQFCVADLKGKTVTEITVMAQEAGFLIHEAAVLVITARDKPGGHQCHIAFDSGIATDVSVFYLF